MAILIRENKEMSPSSNTTTSFNPKPCSYGCNTKIYWNNDENPYFEVFSGNKRQYANSKF